MNKRKIYCRVGFVTFRFEAVCKVIEITSFTTFLKINRWKNGHGLALSRTIVLRWRSATFGQLFQYWIWEESIGQADESLVNILARRSNTRRRVGGNNENKHWNGIMKCAWLFSNHHHFFFFHYYTSFVKHTSWVTRIGGEQDMAITIWVDNYISCTPWTISIRSPELLSW